ncbi:MAG: AGE family epimerase/isomerase [Planctomycetota bacterium]
MQRQDLTKARDRYRSGLLDDVVPFWLRHAVDREHGGFLFCRDRDGSLLDTDKSIWAQGRCAWLLGTLYADVEARPEWLEGCRHGVDFLRRHGFDADGRMYFQVTRDGRPLRKRRYVFSECFTVIALAALARATGDHTARDEAVALFDRVTRLLTTPGALPPKVDPVTRPQKGLAVPMILIVTAQELRKAAPDHTACTAWIDRSIAEIERDFLKPEFEAVLESVGPNGEFLDHFDGRLLNPGHAIEAAWFILDEARHRGGDARLVTLGTRILDWMWRWGWDEEHGGILYFRDCRAGPPAEYWHDMKFWWPQNEATIATLMAYAATGDETYAVWHQAVDTWMHDRFPDPEHGEWFGYLHRDGRLSSTVKGNHWKSCFHVPRMQLRCWQLCDELLARSEPS